MQLVNSRIAAKWLGITNRSLLLKLDNAEIQYHIDDELECYLNFKQLDMISEQLMAVTLEAEITQMICVEYPEKAIAILLGDEFENRDVAEFLMIEYGEDLSTEILNGDLGIE